MKKLYRSRDNKVMAGIFGGLGEYLDIDPTVLRLCFILLLAMTGPAAVVGYIIACFVVPKKPHHHATEATYTEKPKEENK